jgi:DNA-binding response OmpR family regulator
MRCENVDLKRPITAEFSERGFSQPAGLPSEVSLTFAGMHQDAFLDGSRGNRKHTERAMPCLLVIDDDTVLCELLTDYLKPEGFEVTSVHDGEEGLHRVLEGAGAYDLIVLDLMLPSMNGFQVLQHIRSKLETPVLMMTASHEEMNRVVGLEMGADDFLTKPFNLRELVARVRAILRRTKDHPATVTPLSGAEPIVIGDIEMDPGSRMVCCKGEPLQLTSVEFGFLEMLIRAAGQVVTREQLAEKILGRTLTAYDHSMYVHVSSLRRKLGHKSGGIDRIKTVRGIGYLYAHPSPFIKSVIMG